MAIKIESILSSAFNEFALEKSLPIRFLSSGGLTLTGRVDSIELWEAVAFWCRAFAATQLAAGAAPVRRPKIVAPWVVTPHPNVVMNRRVRLGLTHIVHRVLLSNELSSDRVRSIVNMVNGTLTYPKHTMVAGGRISIMDYVKLWLDTIGPKIREIDELLVEGQLLTWLGLDADGGSAESISSQSIAHVNREFMHWTISWYQSCLRELHAFGLYNPIKDSHINPLLARLEATKPGVKSGRLRGDAFRDPDECVEALKKVRSKVDPGDQKTLDRLIRRVRIFGFTTLEPQPRINAAAVWTTLQAIAKSSPHLSSVPREHAARAEWLNKQLRIRTIFSLPEIADSDEVARWMLDVLKGYLDVSKRTARMNTIVLAGTTSEIDPLAAQLLLRWTGLKLEVVPLPEDYTGLKSAGKIARAAKHGVLIGCSDSVRTAGAIAGWTDIGLAIKAVEKVGRLPWIGRGLHLLRGGFFPLQSGGTLWQGADVYAQAFSDKLAARTICRSPERVDPIPEIWSEISKVTRRSFEQLIDSSDFNKLWQLSKLAGGIAQNPRPASRGGNGSATQKVSWATGRAIGAVQTSESVLSYFPHIYGSGKPLLRRAEELAVLYRKGCWFTRRVVGALQQLLGRTDLNHFSAVAKGSLTTARLEEIRNDYDQIIAAIRIIIKDPSWSPESAPAWVITARREISSLVAKRTRTDLETLRLRTIMLSMLAWAKTSG